MIKIVVDSSVIIDYIRVKKGLLPQLIELSRQKKITLYIPTAVIVEFWSGLSMSIKENENALKVLLQTTKIISLTRQLAEESGLLRREGSVSEFADSVIAATTLYLDAELATQNRKHFEKVRGLKLFEMKKN